MSSLAVGKQETSCVQFLRDVPPITCEVNAVLRGEARDVAQLIAEYTVFNQNPFGTAEWKKGGIDAGPEVPFAAGFAEWWNGPDPLDVYQRVPHPRPVSETHFAPIFAPRFFTHIQSNTLYPRSLRVLAKLGIVYNWDSEPIMKNRDKTAGPAYWLVIRKAVLATHCLPTDGRREYLKDLNAKTNAGYEELPSALDLTTYILARAIAGEDSCLNDVEDPIMVSHCKGEPQMFFVNFPKTHIVAVEETKPTTDWESLGVTALRKC